jgi:hypothetical protein
MAIALALSEDSVRLGSQADALALLLCDRFTLKSGYRFHFSEVQFGSKVGVVRVEVIMLKPLALAVAVSASAPLAAYVAYALGEHTRSAADIPYDWQSLNRKSPRYSPLDRKRLDGLVRKVAEETNIGGTCCH